MLLKTDCGDVVISKRLKQDEMICYSTDIIIKYNSFILNRRPKTILINTITITYYHNHH